MDSEKREMCSLEKEFRLLRPFVPKQLPNRRCYSEEEILAAEYRLDYKLPPPLRSIYLYMADLLFAWNYLRPLELLHWDHDHLGFFLSGDWDCIIGICRNADPNRLYFWEEDDPKDGSYVFEDAFEACDKIGDESGKQKAAQEYRKYWEAIGNDPSLSQDVFSSQNYDSLLDVYALFLSLHTLCKDYEALAHKANCGINIENLDLYLRSDDIKYDPVSLQDLSIKIQQVFIPLSEHTELILSDSPPLLMVYLHPKKHILLVQRLEDPDLTLLAPEKIVPDILAEIEHNIGLTFHHIHRQFD